MSLFEAMKTAIFIVLFIAVAAGLNWERSTLRAEKSTDGPLAITETFGISFGNFFHEKEFRYGSAGTRWSIHPPCAGEWPSLGAFGGPRRAPVWLISGTMAFLWIIWWRKRSRLKPAAAKELPH